MAENQASTTLSDDDLATVTGGKGSLDAGSTSSFGGGMNVEEIMESVQQARMNQLDEAIKSSLIDMKARNDTIHELNQGLSVLSAAEKGMEGPVVQVSANALAAEAGYRTVDEFTKALGLPANAVQDGAFSKEELRSAMTGVKTQIDAVNSQSQMDMLRLQTLMNKRNEAFDGAPNWSPKDDTSISIG